MSRVRFDIYVLRILKSIPPDWTCYRDLEVDGYKLMRCQVDVPKYGSREGIAYKYLVKRGKDHTYEHLRLRGCDSDRYLKIPAGTVHSGKLSFRCSPCVLICHLSEQVLNINISARNFQ